MNIQSLGERSLVSVLGTNGPLVICLEAQTVHRSTLTYLYGTDSHISSIEFAYTQNEQTNKQELPQ